ncbi:MAG: archaeal heat shock protein Hsp20 [Candidatus Njordarchaeales archaeon]
MTDDKKKRKDDYWEEDPFERFLRRFFGSRSPFEEFFREFNDMLRRFMREIESFEYPFEKDVFKEKKGPIKSYVYGFSITIGPDGVPRIKEFGNIRPTAVGVVTREEWEPLSTVYSEDDKIRVIIDLPGAKKESIKINASETDVEVKAEAGDRKYYKRIQLPEEVIPESAKARYNNGILEITFEKKKKGKKTTEIPVE